MSQSIIDFAAGSEEQMGQTIMEALAEFVSEKKPVNLQQVYLVIFQDKMVKNMLKGVRSGGQSAAAGYKGMFEFVELTATFKKTEIITSLSYYLLCILIICVMLSSFCMTTLMNSFLGCHNGRSSLFENQTGMSKTHRVHIYFFFRISYKLHNQSQFFIWVLRLCDRIYIDCA